MANLSKRYLGVEIEKDKRLRTGFGEVAPGAHNVRQIMYAAGDVVYPFYIAAEQKKEIKERALSSICQIEYDTVAVLAKASVKGLKIDVPAWRMLYQEAVQERASAELELNKLLFKTLTGQLDMFGEGRPVYKDTAKILNYRAAEHVKWAVRAHCKSIDWSREVVTDLSRLLELKKQYGRTWLDNKRAKNQPADAMKVPQYLIPEKDYVILLSAETPTLRLARIRGQLPSDLVELLVKFSKYNKRVTTYGMSFIDKHVDAEGVMHPDFHQVITSTGRLSSEPNSQNIPKDKRYRACFIPRPGYKFVIIDYSQIEPRI